MIIGHEMSNNNPVKIDIQRVLEGRMLIQANSGGGKSYTVRKFAEITHGKVQQIIIDIEGEFSSLREKYDYILVGKDGDIPINLRASELLAKKLLELNTSAIIDLYELKHHERKRFVKTFIDSLINLPKELWHPCIIIIDECHIFAPESKSGQAESLDSIKDLATRGRKRGYALVCATQRLSKLSKDVVAELNSKLIGRSSLDVDMKRASFELGFSDKKDILSLRELKKGEFYAFGPALTSKVTKIKIDKVKTKHPEAGTGYQKIKSATPEKVKMALLKLKDLPQEAEQEIKTLNDMKRRIIELKRENIALKNQQVKQDIDPKKLEVEYLRGYNNSLKESEKTQNEITMLLKNFHSNFSRVLKSIQELYSSTEKIQIDYNYLQSQITKTTQITKPNMFKTLNKEIPMPPRPIIETDVNDKKLRLGAMKMLKATAQFFPNSITKHQMATFAGISYKSGTFGQYLSELKKLEWIKEESKDIFILTDEGQLQAGNVEPLPTDSKQLIEQWGNKFRRGARDMLIILTDAYPLNFTKEELGYRANISYTSGTFGQYLSELKRNGLIEIDGEHVKASKTLFPLEAIQ